MLSYQQTKRLIIFVVTLYFVAGILLKGLGSSNEIFPFYAWDLFSVVPNKVRNYDVYIVEHKGSLLKTPLLYHEAKGYILESHSIDAREVINKLGNQIEFGRLEADSSRKLFEETYIPNVTKYEIVKVIYDPLERYRSDKYTIIKIATFEKTLQP